VSSTSLGVLKDLATEPSHDSWRRLVELLEGWSDDRSLAVQHVAEHLKLWPPGLRRYQPFGRFELLLQGDWWDKHAVVPEDAHPDLWPVVDELCLSTRYSAGFDGFYKEVDPYLQPDGPLWHELISNPGLSSLRCLDLAGQELTDGQVETLVRSGRLTRLEELSLEHNDEVDEAIVHLACVSGLRVLALNNCSIQDSSVVAMLEAWPGCPLRALSLRDTQVTDACCRALGSSLSNVEVLDLGVNHVGPEGAAALRAGPLPRLRSLRLGGCGNRLGPAGLKSILSAPWTSQLRLLELGRYEYFRGYDFDGWDISEAGNSIELEGLQELSSCKELAQLRHLFLADGDVNRETVSLLTAAPFFQQLETLDLSFNELEDEGGRALAEALVSGCLKQLYLAYARLNSVDAPGVGVEFARALARSAGGANLETLDLAFSDVEASGLLEIAASPHLKNLRKLDLYMNRVGDEALEAFAMSENFAHLEALLLRYNLLTDRAAVAIANSPFSSKLRMLYLQGNRIGDEGARALARSPHLNQLECLFLGDNHLSDEGSAALERPPGLPKLHTLETWPSPEP